MRTLAGPDGEDETTTHELRGTPSDVDLSRLTVLVVRENGRLDVSDELKDAIERAARRALGRVGAWVRC